MIRVRCLATVVLCWLITAGQAFPASFYWKTTLVDLQNISTVASGDRGIVITAAGVVSFYSYSGSAWVEILNSSLSGTTASSWQIDQDNSGPILKNESGTLSVRNSGDTAAAAIRASGFDAVQTALGPGLSILYEDSDNGTDYFGWGSPASRATSVVLLGPTADPADQVMVCAAPSGVTFADGVSRSASACTWTTLGALATAAWPGAGIPQSTGSAWGSSITLGTGIAAALAINVGSAGAPVLYNGALGTPSSGTLTNCTFPTLNQSTSGNAATATALAANAANCSAGYAALGVDASGAAEGCWQITPAAIGSMSNPMTTQYDLIYGGSSGTPTRVATSAGFIAAIGNALNGSGGLITYGNAAGAAAVLTGYTSGAGTVAATDTILQAIQKLNGNIAALTTWTGANSETITNADDTEIAFNGVESIALDLDAGTNKVEWKNKTTGSTSVDTMGFAALNLVTTGTIQGGIKISSDADGMDATAMTTAGMYGTLFVATGAGTWTLPTAAAGMSACLMDSGTAHDLILDVTSGDTMRLKGTEGSDGVGITNASGTSTGDFICVVAVAANKWSTVGMQGTWASQ